MVHFSLLKFCTVCKTSPNSHVYTALQFQRANQKHEEVERIEAKVNNSSNSKKKECLTEKGEEGEEQQEIERIVAD
jgi:hypothetical protein